MTITKYDASGNNFVIFHTNKRDDYSQLAIKLCKEENTDGLIVLVPHMVFDFEWLFYNRDGSTASMCGNGTRAVAHYAFENRIASNYMKFLTGAGEIDCRVDDDIVETTMTKPKELKAPFIQDGFQWWHVDTGVPHLVTIVDDLEKFDLELSSKMRYQYNANVNFAKIEDGKLLVRTYERGVEGETLACGTGMTACFLRAVNLNLIGDSVDVIPKSGEILSLRKDAKSIYFKGKVTKEYTKEIDEKDI
ncbi:MAG: diaminopimelate epimerase [Campylobacterota bacterium]|nr:diaminopimelate epimerase [Campylobacterota bacterium]